MRFSSSILALPTSLVLLVVHNHPAQALHDHQYSASVPHNLPRDAKTWLKDPLKRSWDVEAVKHLIREGARPVGVKKMTTDSNEKFYPEYWGFGEQEMQKAIVGIERSWALRKTYHEDEEELLSNGSMPLSFRPAFPLHSEKENSLTRRNLLDSARAWLAKRSAESTLAMLKKRGFECVTGTSACTSINQPNLCCATGETCYTIPDTGLGTVGCCPANQNCGGSITCASGNTPCLVNNTGGYTGGGCCIPGYVCAGVGCAPSASPSTSVVISTQTIVTSASPTVLVVTTQTQTILPTVTPSTSTVTKTETSATSTPTSTNSASGEVPVRATTVSDTSSSTVTDSTCPTGYYACSATYRGCCQVGRDCHTTNCPAQASTTIISSGQTVVVPLTPSATTTASGHCATGWTSCAASLGGACCPSDWGCGTVSCYSSTGPSQSASQPKEGVVLNSAIRVGGGSAFMALAAKVGFIFALMIFA